MRFSIFCLIILGALAAVDCKSTGKRKYPDEDMDMAKALLKCIRKESAKNVRRPDPKDDRLLVDDIIPTLPQVEQMAIHYDSCREEVKKGKKRGRGRNPRQVSITKYPGSWSDGVVNWQPDNALEGIQTATGGCVTFKERSSGVNVWEDHIHIRTGSGCWSAIGNLNYRQWGQTLNLEPECMTFGIIQHEFIHALGVHHEQTRADRDNYVTIMTENIQAGMEMNFEKCTDCVSQGVIDDVPYDYRSLMHYNASAFSSNGQRTIVSKTSTAINRSHQLTSLDAKLLKKIYCTVNCVGSWSAYGSCSKTCGGGTQTKTYTVTTPASIGGTYCVAANGQTQTRSCNTDVCAGPVHCVGSWSAYEACSRTCLGGIQTRTYSIITQELNGGMPCETTDGETQTRTCNTQACSDEIECGNCLDTNSVQAACNVAPIKQCVCAADPFCCNTYWGAVCVTEVATVCNVQCEPPTTTNCGTCKTVQSTPGCSVTSIEACVCAVDPFCCNKTWDAYCVTVVTGVLCGFTCA